MNEQKNNSRQRGREKAIHALMYAYYQRHGHLQLPSVSRRNIVPRVKAS